MSALRILRSELPSAGTHIVVLGMSRGSEAAMLAAIHASIRVRAVVATVPGNIVAGGLPPGGPAWLPDGRPLHRAEDKAARADAWPKVVTFIRQRGASR
jgi:dienelactone hydrolase